MATLESPFAWLSVPMATLSVFDDSLFMPAAREPGLVATAPMPMATESWPMAWESAPVELAWKYLVPVL
ncbi:hypothetical protein D3C87_1595990 [compost metagenome]